MHVFCSVGKLFTHEKLHGVALKKAQTPSQSQPDLFMNQTLIQFYFSMTMILTHTYSFHLFQYFSLKLTPFKCSIKYTTIFM